MSSYPQDVIDQFELQRNSCASNINALQMGLIPNFLKLIYTKTDKYFCNNRLEVSRLPFQVVLDVEGIRNNIAMNLQENLYKDSMVNAVANTKYQPFLLFLNNTFIKWSDITLIRNYSKFYILADGFDRDVLNKVDIVYLPCNVKYSEEGDSSPFDTVLFRFNEDGTIGDDDSPIVLSTEDQYLDCFRYEAKEPVLNCKLGIDKHFLLTNDNVFLFKNGLLDTTTPRNMRSLNLFTIDDGKDCGNTSFIVFHNTFSNSNLSAAIKPPNEDYLNDVQQGTKINTRIQQTEFEKHFDLTMDRNETYDNNLANGLSNLYQHDQSLMDDVYLKRSKVPNALYTGAQIKSKLQSGNLVMPRHSYTGYGENFVIVFLNGEIYENYHLISYDINNFTIPFGTIEDTDIIEIFYFKEVNNTVIQANISNGEAIGVKPYRRDELTILSDYDTTTDAVIPGMLFKVSSALNADNTVIYKNPYFYDKDVTFVSSRQYKYHYEINTTATNSVTLPDMFKTCLDKQKYLIFINKRLVNSNNYKMSFEVSSYTSMTMNLNFTLNVDDRLEIFYVPENATYINSGFKIIIDSIKVIATEDNQSVFRIPYPYTRYVKDKTGFIVSIGSTVIQPNRYELIDNNTKIRLLYEEDFLLFGRNVIFVFLYNLFSLESLDVTPENHIKFITKKVAIIEDGQKDIDLPFPDVANFILSISGLFIDPSRYTIANGKLSFVSDDDYLDEGQIASFIYAYKEYEDRYIAVQVKVIEAENDKQSLFQLPTKYVDNFIVSKGSIVIDRLRYDVNDGQLELVYNDDWLYKGETLTFIYLPEDVNNKGKKMHNRIGLQSDLAELNMQTVFELPFLYNDYDPTDYSFLTVVGDTLIDQERYDVSTGKFKFIDSDDGLPKGLEISYLYAYSTATDDVIYGDSIERDDIRVLTKSVQVTDAAQRVYPIPNIDRSEWTDFFITIGSTILDESQYIIDKAQNNITLNDNVLFDLNDNIFYHFVYNDFIVVHKQVVTINATEDYQRRFDIPMPDAVYPNTKFAFMLIVGSVIIDKTRFYTVDNNKKIVLYDSVGIRKGDQLSFMCYYFGDDANRPRILPQSGYLYFNRRNAICAVNKELYLLFVNGKKITKDNIIDIADNLIRIKADPKTKFNVSMLTFSKEIPEVKDLKDLKANLTYVMDYLEVSDLNTLYEVDTIMTDDEPHRPDMINI